METEQEKQFLKQYIESACPGAEVNKLLRQESKNICGLFDNLFSFGETPSRLFRLLPNSYVKLSNNRYCDKGYLSCSDDIDKVISHFSSEDLACFVIQMPSRISRIVVNEIFPEQNNEGEYILPHGLELVVRNTQQFVTDNDLTELISSFDISENIKSFRDILRIKSITVYHMSIMFYHASVENYEVGKTYTTDQFTGDTTRFHNSLDEAKKQTDILLDEHRPEGCDSRLKSFYIFQDVKHCADYASFLHTKNVKVYAIEPTSKVFGGFPMCLVNKAHIEKDESIKAKIIQEYWNPEYPWKFNEYLTQSIKIIDILELSPPSCSMDYDYDQTLFQTFLKGLNKKTKCTE